MHTRATRPIHRLAVVVAATALLLCAYGRDGGTRALAAAAVVDGMPVPAALQVPLLLKILTYDRNLGAKGETSLHVAIVSAPGVPASARTSSEIAAVLKSLADKTVRKLQVRYTTVEYTSDQQMLSALPTDAVNMVYISPGNERNLPSLVNVSKTRQALTATGVPDYVQKGVAIGIGVRQDKPEILINLAATKAAGSEFDAGLLRIVSVVR